MATQLELVPPRAADAADRRLALWATRHPWAWAITIGLGGLLLTAVGVGYGEARQLDPVTSTYVQAAFVALSALLGMIVMWRTRPSLAEYGFRPPRHLDRALWVLPLAVAPVVILVAGGIHVSAGQVLGIAALTVAVGFNEEIWYRGLLLATLRRRGSRHAVVGASVVFAAVHLTNLFAGRDLLYLVLQFVFAGLVGIVLAELVEITGSLWIGIAWHVVFDLAGFSNGDVLTPGALVGIGILIPVVATYAVWLWRQLPERASDLG